MVHIVYTMFSSRTKLGFFADYKLRVRWPVFGNTGDNCQMHYWETSDLNWVSHFKLQVTLLKAKLWLVMLLFWTWIKNNKNNLVQNNEGIRIYFLGSFYIDNNLKVKIKKRWKSILNWKNLSFTKLSSVFRHSLLFLLHKSVKCWMQKKMCFQNSLEKSSNSINFSSCSWWCFFPHTRGQSYKVS